MKKIILLTFLVSLVLFAKAQSKIDSAIKKADTISSKPLNNTRVAIITIQENISKLLDAKETNQYKIDSLNKSIALLSNKKDRSLEENNQLKSELNQLKNSINSGKKVIASLAKQKADLNQEIDNAKKQLESTNKKIDSANKKIDTLNNKLNQKNVSILKADTTLAQREASVASQLDLLETVATIEMLDFTNIYSSNIIVKAKIKEVHINVTQGVILEIIVKTDKGDFRNKGRTDGIIIADLLHFEDFTEKKLYKQMFTTVDPLEEAQKEAHIFLKDVIRYIPISSYTDAVYGEFEITLLPTKEKRMYLIKESTSINTYFNVAAFTDIKGISGEPNGIAQFTADAKFMLNTKAISRTSVIGANYISFQGGLSKFDTEFKGTQLDNKNGINRKDLLQRANYKLGVKLNLLKGYLPSVPVFLYNTLELNMGYNVIGTKVFKTGFKDAAKTVIDTTFRTVTQNQWYAEPTITFSRRKNFSMCLALPVYMNNIKKSSGIENNHTEYWAVPGISLMYFGKRDVGSKLFFRYNHYINVNDKTQAFSQMQLGYSLNLTQVLNK